ncbi:DUF348 domain-containing protein [bacterium]|nr:MAG: DUF348 domain-containing protein [bacterium]
MRHLVQKTATPVAILVFACIVITMLIAHFFIAKAGAASQDDARNGRLVTIHDRGQQKVILTDAQSIGDALKQADIVLDKRDTVEPAVDEKLIATDYSVNIYRARPVIVVDGAVRQKIMTPYQTSDKIAKDAGVTLHDEDKTVLAASDDIVNEGAGLTLTIDRATAFTLTLYGQKTESYTQEKTVGAMLASKDITLAADDTLSVTKDALMQNGMNVEIWRNGKQVITEEKEIAFDTEKIQDADREIGFREIQTPGVKGKKTVSFEIEMKNGKEVARKEIQSVVTAQPKKQVEVVGAKPVFSGSFADALAKLRTCESGGNYANKKNPLYRGAYQYGYSTWGNKYGVYDPADATPAQQDQAAWETYQRRGWQPWPHCGSTLPDTYR